MKLLLLSFKPLFRFYLDGFRDMPAWGRRSWLIIIIKLFIMFAILKVFFFHDFLAGKFDNDSQRSEYVLNQILKSPVNHD